MYHSNKTDKDINLRKELFSPQNSLYKEIFETANSIMLIWDTQGEIIFMNDFGLSFFGYKPDELFGKSVIGTIVAKRASSGRDLEDMIKNICAETQAYLSNDNENMKKDGSKVWISWSNKRINIEGRGEAILSIGNDVTQKMLYQIELQQTKDNLEEMVRQRTLELEKSEAKYRALADNAALGIAMFYAGKISYANKTLLGLFGYTEQELFDKGIMDLTAPEDRDAVAERHKKRMKGEKTDNKYEVKLLRKDGTTFLAEANVGAFFVKESGGFVATFEDITDKKAAEMLEKRKQEELFQASKMVSLGTLVSGIAHEINNPNNFIMLNTPLLKDSWDDVVPVLDKHLKDHGDFKVAGINYSEMRDAIPELFKGVQEGSDRIKNIISGLKDFARKDTGSIKDEIDINEVVNSALILLDNRVKKCASETVVDLKEDLCMIKGNFQKLEQVILNLLNNACEAMTEPGRISLKTYFSDNKVYLEISDEGIGMDDETKKMILDPFYTTKRESGGTGLGLPISSEIIKEHGGELSFSSVQGEGTKAILMIPCIKGRENE